MPNIFLNCFMGWVIPRMNGSRFHVSVKCAQNRCVNPTCLSVREIPFNCSSLTGFLTDSQIFIKIRLTRARDLI